MNIVGKNALVLGATKGIGLAIARSLAEKGAHLILPWFDWPQESKNMCDYFSHTNEKHLTIQADLRETADVIKLTKAIKEQFNHLDILINNIERGGMPIVHGSYHRPINNEQWQLEMETTLHAKWKIFEHCQPLLEKSEAGAVINISSIAACTGRSGPAGLLFNDGYAAANRGVQSLTKTWARQCAPKIRVNEIMLGFFDTRHGPGTRGWKELSGDDRQKIKDHTLLKRTGKPEEVATTALFILEQADFMTGSIIRLDGGYLLGGENIAPMPAGII